MLALTNRNWERPITQHSSDVRGFVKQSITDWLPEMRPILRGARVIVPPHGSVASCRGNNPYSCIRSRKYWYVTHLVDIVELQNLA